MSHQSAQISISMPTPPTPTKSATIRQQQTTSEKGISWSSSNVLKSSLSTSSKNGKRNRSVVFTHEEVIPDYPSSSKSIRRVIGVRMSSSKIKRSPTPLSSLSDLANDHTYQLSSLWREHTLNTLEIDKNGSIETGRGENDPFDF